MELITERLILRDFVADDWPAVLAYQSDPRYLKYYAWTGRTAEQVQTFLQLFIHQQGTKPRIKFQLAVTLKDSGALIGNCGIRKEFYDAHQADMGYELAPDYWGQGYATEAAQAIVNFGFNDLRLHRIWADCVADNLASAHVLEKVGLRLEGRLRDHQFYKDRWWDTLLFGMLESDWRELAITPE
jgi:ribosomal-protein-alanine N-acetyltransferase